MGKPQIDRIYPTAGIVRSDVTTNITIYGKNFGAIKGETRVLFAAPPYKEAELVDCKNNWSDTIIMIKAPVAVLPLNMNTASFKISKPAKGDSNSVIFKRDDSKIYPFLCSLDPSHGLKGDALVATGTNFGNSNVSVVNGKTYNLQSNVDFVFSQNLGDDAIVSPDNIKSWTTTALNFLTPDNNINSASANVSVQINPSAYPYIDTNKNGIWNAGETFFNTQTGRENDGSYNPGAQFNSNDLPFDFNPVITSVTPDNGPNKSWITITGYNFGKTAGTVCFDSTCAAYFPPLPCKNNWSNTQIIVAVPDNLSLGGIQLSIKTTKNLQSNFVNFTVNANPLAPGICDITPAVNYIGYYPYIYGTRFGDTQGASQVIFNSNKSSAIYYSPPGWTDTYLRPRIEVGSTSGFAYVSKKVQVGQACVGFSIGSFCPSGQYSPIYQTLLSNPFFVTILQNPPPPSSGTGAKCTSDAECQQNNPNCLSKCVEGICEPYIADFSPKQGPLGTWVTINGCHFGCAKGNVYFTGLKQSNYTNNETAFFDFKNNTNDVSGHDNNVTPINSVTGAIDNSILKDGYVDLNGTNQCLISNYNCTVANPCFNSGSADGVDGITVAAWIKIPEQPTGNYVIASQGGGNYGGYDFWDLFVSSDRRLYIYLNNYPTASLQAGTAALTIPLNTWVHVAAVAWTDVSKNTTYLRVYINGVEHTLNINSLNAIALPQTRINPLLIGAISWFTPSLFGQTYYKKDLFKGQIDDVRFYNRPLSPDDVKRINDFGNENVNGGLGYNVLGLQPGNANCTFWNCSANGFNDQITIEVPNKNTETTNDDAHTGPIEVVTGDKLVENTSHLASGNFTVNADSLPPNICKVEPGLGSAGQIVKIFGDNLKFSDFVSLIPKTILGFLDEPYLDLNNNFSFDNGENYIDINNNGQYDTSTSASAPIKSAFTFSIDSSLYITSSEQGGCPDNYSNPTNGVDSDKTLCFKVPAGAAGEGQPDLTAKNSVSVKRNNSTSNDLDFSVNFPSGSTADALRVESTIPAADQANFCRNGLSNIYFDSLVDPKTITKTNFSLECSTTPLGYENKSGWKKGLAFFKNIFGKLLGTDSSALAANKCPSDFSLNDYALNSIVYQGKTVVTVSPNELLDAGTVFQVTINGGDSGVKKINGAKLEVEKYVFKFETAGDPNLGDAETNGICQVDNIFVFVANTADTNAEDLRENYTDLFTCAGDNCQTSVDFDQSSLAGNQHRYHAVAKSIGGVTIRSNYTWSRSDDLDPRRALSFHEVDSSGENADTNSDQNKFTNTSGQVYVTNAPISETVSKLIIQAQAEGVSSNVKQRDFTVYLLLCRNPWPSLDQRTFPEAQINAYNFGTWYCRDAPPGFNEDLPAAKIIQ
ncbi:MAG: hypothetical protein PHC97_02820 [Patescibacteria group bacterium]|nr:hypothetical protein [Patescibacteria group bacterium]